MQSASATRLKNRLLSVFALISVGLIAVGIMGTLYINSMKKDVDSIYFKSVVPISQLNDILYIYHNDLANTVYKAVKLEISANQTSSKIENSLFKIKTKWKSYSSNYGSKKDIDYFNSVAVEIKATNIYFSKILKESLNGEELKKISLDKLQKHIFHINSVIDKLIQHEVDTVYFKRQNFYDIYNNIVIILGSILIISIILLIIIAIYSVRSIEEDKVKLELTAKKLTHVNTELKNVSYTDSLTKLHNRNYFNLIYDKELKRAKRDRTYITFMMLDMDYFKQYNDVYGHVEGDKALSITAKVLKETLKRPSDFLFRLGGEEFGVLLTQTDEVNSARLAQNICNAVRDRKIENKKSNIDKYLTISIGLVCCIADNALHDEILISRANEMLYKAKNNGRNRYEITTDVTQSTVVND